MTPEEAKAQNAVQAIGSPDSSRISRVDIDEFLADNDMTNLFLLALAAMQVEDANLGGKTEDWWTFYSLAGIHGRPKEDWARIPNTSGTGYCTHGQFVFPTWHRVYINQFEQAVYCKMKVKAKEFTVEPYKSRYAAAAERFRLPYWDPLMPRYDSKGRDSQGRDLGRIPDDVYSPMRWGLPKILSTEFVHVRIAPDGKADPKFKNPLYSFNMPSKETMGKKQRTHMSFGVAPYHDNLTLRTLRSPDNGETNLGDVNDSDLRKEGLHAYIRNQNQNIGDRMWKLLARYNDTKNVPPVQDPNSRQRTKNQDNTERVWENFACHDGVDPKTLLIKRGSQGSYNDTAVSLESWHDNIHGLVGAGTGTWWKGNMTDPAIASFDPIFWLHHNNIDRLFAIYQVLNPNSYVRSAKETKEHGAGHLDSPLEPFKKPQSRADVIEFYTSADVRDWTGLGYAVPGNKDLGKAGQDQVARYLNKWYDWIAQGKAPPKDVLDHWPKDLSSSYALNGDKAKPEQPIRIEALSNNGLATQEISTMSLTEELSDLNFTEAQSSFEVDTEYLGLPTETIKGSQTLTYTATVRVKKFAFNGTFHVHLFIGDVNDSIFSQFIVQENEIGFSTIFASPPDAPCANCVVQMENGLMFQDGIPLSTALYKYLQSNENGPRTLESLHPRHVVPFLQERLEWRVIGPTGLIPSDQYEGAALEITVSARVYELPTNDNPLGIYYESIDIPQITNSKAGGSRDQTSLPLEGLPEIIT